MNGLAPVSCWCGSLGGAAAPPAAARRGVFTQGVIARPLPPPADLEKKKKLFCIEGINSRHLVVARN